MTIDRQDQKALAALHCRNAHGIEGLVSPDELSFVLQLQLMQLSSLSLLQHYRCRAVHTYLHVINHRFRSHSHTLSLCTSHLQHISPAQQLTLPCHPGQAAKNIPSAHKRGQIRQLFSVTAVESGLGARCASQEASAVGTGSVFVLDFRPPHPCHVSVLASVSSDCGSGYIFLYLNAVPPC